MNKLKKQICADANITRWVGGMGYPSDIAHSGKFYEHNLCISITDNPSPGVFHPMQILEIGTVPDIDVPKILIYKNFQQQTNRD